jgi:hypothetical protein
MPRITKWPAIFLHVGAVKTFIANMCPETNDMVFDGVENHVFQGYVLFHTARSAWEGRVYDIQHVPKGWKRVSIHKTVQVPKTLTGTPSPFPLSPHRTLHVSPLIMMDNVDRHRRPQHRYPNTPPPPLASILHRPQRSARPCASVLLRHALPLRILSGRARLEVEDVCAVQHGQVCVRARRVWAGRKGRDGEEE